MEKQKWNKLKKYISHRCKLQTDYLITDKIFFSKVSMSNPFQRGIERIYGKESLTTIYIPYDTYHYNIGYRLGLLFECDKLNAEFPDKK